MDSSDLIVVLNDGETFSTIGGCQVIETTHRNADDIEEMLQDHPAHDPKVSKYWNIAEIIRENEELKKEIEELREIDHQEYSVRRDEDIKDICGIDGYDELEDFVFENEKLKKTLNEKNVEIAQLNDNCTTSKNFASYENYLKEELEYYVKRKDLPKQHHNYVPAEKITAEEAVELALGSCGMWDYQGHEADPPAPWSSNDDSVANWARFGLTKPEGWDEGEHHL